MRNTKTACSVLTGLLLVLLAGASAVHAQTYGYWQQRQYDQALVTMGADSYVNTYTGAGTAIVVFEPGIPFLDAELLDEQGNPTGERIFGNCDNIFAPGGVGDFRGWEPGGTDCKIAWVMCFVSTEEPEPEQRQQNCNPDNGYWTAERTHHVTSVANGIATVAPDAKIISIYLHEERSDTFRMAVEWLLHPSSDKTWYLNNGYTTEEANFYKQYFGGQSPADYWNVVATSASLYGIAVPHSTLDDNLWLIGAFSRACTFADNPNPQGGLQYDKYVRDYFAQYQITESSDPPLSDWIRKFEHYETYSAVLKAAGIMPFVASHNFISRQNIGTETSPVYLDFITSDGVGFPGCLEDTYTVSGVSPWFQNFQAPGQVGNKNRYVLTNSSPELTDFVSPGGASSFSTPMAAASAAVIKSTNLIPDASIGEVEAYLSQTSLSAPTDISCNDSANYAIGPFPDAQFRSPDPGAHPDLNCGCHTSPSLPVLELGSGIDAALSP